MKGGGMEGGGWSNSTTAVIFQCVSVTSDKECDGAK